MNKLFFAICVLTLNGCTTYAGIEKSGEDEYLLLENTYFIFTFPSVQKCKMDKQNHMVCSNVNINDADSEKIIRQRVY